MTDNAWGAIAMETMFISFGAVVIVWKICNTVILVKRKDLVPYNPEIDDDDEPEQNR